MTAPDPVDELLTSWRKRAREAQWAHYGCERRLLRMHFWVGVPLVVLSTFSGTAVFATLSTDPSTTLKLVVGATAVVVAVLGGVQTFLRATDRAGAHRAAATKYAALRRELEQIRACDIGAQPGDVLDRIRDRMDELADAGPVIPQPVWNRTEKALRKRDAIEPTPAASGAGPP